MTNIKIRDEEHITLISLAAKLLSIFIHILRIKEKD